MRSIMQDAIEFVSAGICKPTPGIGNGGRRNPPWDESVDRGFWLSMRKQYRAGSQFYGKAVRHKFGYKRNSFERPATWTVMVIAG